MYSLVIRNGRVVDPGTRTETNASIGIEGDRIACITDQEISGAQVIDAHGLVVCPGFVDVHGHVDGVTSYPNDKACATLSLLQGVTTLINGNCGVSVQNIPSFFDRMDKGFPIHQAELIGASTLRKMVGACNIYAPATERQIEHMCCIAHNALYQGACGISFGMGYTPGTSMQEAYAIARVAKQFGRPVAIDTRMQDDFDLNSLDEVIAIAHATGARVLVSHLVYQYGEQVMQEALDMLVGARADGLDIWADSGMYVDWATGIGSECFRESYIFANESLLPSLLVATGEYAGQHLDDALYRMMRLLHPNETVICRTGAEHSIQLPFFHDFTMPSSDTAPYNPGEGHPQIAGSFAAYFRMIREQETMSLVEAIYRATLLPAQLFGFDTKGRMEVGADADIVIFDPDTIRDRATHVDNGRPDIPPIGVSHVIVAGHVAAVGQLATELTNGRALRSHCTQVGMPLPVQ